MGVSGGMMELAIPLIEIPAGQLTFTYPPSDIWMAYIYVIAFLFLARVVLLIGPYDQLVRKYAPHAGGLFRQVLRIKKLTGLRGLYTLIIREILILGPPSLFTIGLRLSVGHPGRIGWTEESMTIFAAFVVVWVIFDFMRIFRTRRSIHAITESKWSKPKAMKRVLSTFGWSMQRLSDLAELGGEEITPDVSDKVEQHWAKKSVTTSVGYLKSLTGKSASAAKKAIEGKVQHEFKKGTKMQWKLFLIDMAMSATPLGIIYLMSHLFT